MVEVAGVRHEIDVYVTIDVAQGYRSVFIFECKNWKDPVGKNEIIIFSEKIDACQAQRGYFVAKAFTSDAEAQARTDLRITLLTATEHDIAAMQEPIHCFGRFPELTKLDVTFIKRGSTDTNVQTVEFADSRATYSGEPVDLLRQVNAWARAACDQDLMASLLEPVPEGVYLRSVEQTREFAPNEMLINGVDMETLSLKIGYRVTVRHAPIISHYEVASRGRVIKFARITEAGQTFEAHVVISGLAGGPG